MTRTTIGWVLVTVQFGLLIVLLLLPWRAPTVASAVAGLSLVVAGAVVGLAATRRLGRALTPTPVPIPGAGLRTDGVYRHVRHPIYLAVLLLVLGFDVAVGTTWSWGWSAVIWLFLWGKSRWEDAMLHAVYGDAWQEWAASTGALLPRIRRR